MELIDQWHKDVVEHIESLSQFILSERPICQEYDRTRIDLTKEKHNVFRIISDLYYRENFHSDIICYFLNPLESHGGGNLFLSIFIGMLNELGADVSISNYENAIAVREQGKIDILVYSESSKRAIIIENKIHDAIDMPRQLPRYYEYVTGRGYIVDAIVYIPLDITKIPDKTDWTKEEALLINPLLKIVPAFSDKTRINLVLNWLEPSILMASSVDVISTLRQYTNLVKLLNTQYMDTIIMEKFYGELLNADNLKSAQSIRNMLNDLPQYMVTRIIKRYSTRPYPFTRIRDWKGETAYFGEDDICDATVKIDITCSESGYKVTFWECTGRESSIQAFMALVKNLRILDESKRNAGDSAVFNYFSFAEENEMFDYVDELLSELTGYISFVRNS